MLIIVRTTCQCWVKGLQMIQNGSIDASDEILVLIAETETQNFALENFAL